MVARTSQDLLDKIGFDTIIERIEHGATQAELMREYGVSAGSLNAWLHATSECSARAKNAMRISAEAFLDRGHEALLSADSTQAEIARARALEQHYARRAAVRNPHYSEKVTVRGDADAPLRHEVTRIERVIVDPAATSE